MVEILLYQRPLLLLIILILLSPETITSIYFKARRLVNISHLDSYACACADYSFCPKYQFFSHREEICLMYRQGRLFIQKFNSSESM